MSARGGLVAVHAHPDDETLATGALLATFARAGLPVTVVTCTRGEQGEVIPADLAHLAGDGPALAAHREAELADALAALGVREHLWLDALLGEGRRVVDSGMVWAEPGRAAAGGAAPEGAFTALDVDEGAAALADLLVRRRPDVVVTYEPDGGYGHPDHVQTHRVTTRAVELAVRRDPDVAPVVLWAAVDVDLQRAGRLALAGARLQPEAGREPPSAGLVAAPPDGPRASAVVAGDAVDLVVDVGPVRDRVLAALRAHATQVVLVEPEGPGPVGVALSNGVVEPFLPVESYRVVAGDADAVAWPEGVRR